MTIPKDPRVFSAPERRRRKILDAALELVGEGGADAITHRAVAKRARVSPGSTTYHCGTRDELIRAAFRHYLAEMSALFEAVGLRTLRSTLDDVVELAVDIARRSIAEPVAVRAEYELILFCARDPILAREFVAYERAVESGLARLLERLDVRRPHDADDHRHGPRLRDGAIRAAGSRHGRPAPPCPVLPRGDHGASSSKRWWECRRDGGFGCGSGGSGSPGNGPFDLAVIGAGPAGIGAARALAGSGKSLVVLEARDRIGRRAHSDSGRLQRRSPRSEVSIQAEPSSTSI